jgi:hypothetical protein
MVSFAHLLKYSRDIVTGKDCMGRWSGQTFGLNVLQKRHIPRLPAVLFVPLKQTFATYDVLCLFLQHVVTLYKIIILFPLLQQPTVGQGLLIVEASRSHWDTSHSVGLLWTSDQPDAETSTWQHTTLTRDETSMTPAGSEPTVPTSEQPQSHALAYEIIKLQSCN